MQFQGFDWLSGHGVGNIIPCLRNGDHYISVVWLFLQSEITKIKQHFYFFVNKTVIPLTLVGYEMIISMQLGATHLVGYHLVYFESFVSL